MPSPWASVPSRNTATGLRDIQSEQLATNARAEEDANDKALQAALAASREEARAAAVPVAATRACPACTFENTKPEAIVCEICGTALPSAEEPTSSPTAPAPDAGAGAAKEPLAPPQPPQTSAATDARGAAAEEETPSSVPAVPMVVVVEDEDADLELARALQEEEDRLLAAAAQRQADSRSNARTRQMQERPRGSLAQERDPNWRRRHESVVPGGGAFFGAAADGHGVGEGEDDELEELDPRRHGAEYLVMGDGSIITKHDPAIKGRKNARDAARNLHCMGDIDDFG